jgi:hypothetical protein
LCNICFVVAEENRVLSATVHEPEEGVLLDSSVVPWGFSEEDGRWIARRQSQRRGDWRRRSGSSISGGGAVRDAGEFPKVCGEWRWARLRFTACTPPHVGYG